MIPRDAALALPSRHLGLVQAAEHPDLAAFMAAAGELVEARVELDRLQRLARPPSVSILGPDTRPWPPLGQRIAVAHDRAFAFAYSAVLEGWRRQGVELQPVLAAGGRGAGPRPPTRSICPAATRSFTPASWPATGGSSPACAQAASRGAFVYGECGGYMTLGRTLVDRSGQGHAMAGLLPVVTSFAEPTLHLGYRQIELLAAGPSGRAGAGWRGHEFHYAREVTREGPALFRARCARGRNESEQGCAAGRVAGSFLHLIDRAAHRPPRRATA